MHKMFESALKYRTCLPCVKYCEQVSSPVYPIAGNVCGEFNFTVCCFGRNSQTFHLLKFWHVSVEMIVFSKPQTLIHKLHYSLQIAEYNYCKHFRLYSIISAYNNQ